MNAEFEGYIKDLSPELQEKARQCKTDEELIQLAADEGLELPMDALEAVAGGCTKKKLTCPKCGSDDIRWEPTCGSGDFTYCGNCKYVISSNHAS